MNANNNNQQQKPQQQLEQQGVCDVHKYALNDTSTRMVTWCNACSAWICAECNPNLLLRATAFANRTMQNIFK